MSLNIVAEVLSETICDNLHHHSVLFLFCGEVCPDCPCDASLKHYSPHRIVQSREGIGRTEIKMLHLFPLNIFQCEKI